MKDLPVYDVVMDADPDSENDISAVALVHNPAIKRDFIAFSEQETKIHFAINFEDNEQQKVFGPLLIAGQKVFRVFNGEECYIQFSKQVIDAMAVKFFSKMRQRNVNLNHDQNQKVEDVVMFSSWIVDRGKGIMPMKGYEDVPDGSWFGGFKVNNPEVWAMIKAGEIKGFSVEGFCGMEPVRMAEVLPAIEQIEAILKSS